MIATGTGAGVVLDFAAHVAAQGIKVPVEGRNVTVCYGSDSEPLLRLVTHALLAKRTPAIRVRTALCTLDGQDGQVRCRGAAFKESSRVAVFRIEAESRRQHGKRSCSQNVTIAKGMRGKS